MILDERNEFADAASVAASAGCAVIGDVMDLGVATAYPADGECLYLVIQTDTEVITAGSAGTIQFDLVSDSLATLGAATLASCTTHFSTGQLVTGAAAANDARLNAGGVIAAVELPRGAYERYLGILCTVGTTTVTAGKINAFLTKDVTRWVAHPDAL